MPQTPRGDGIKADFTGFCIIFWSVVPEKNWVPERFAPDMGEKRRTSLCDPPGNHASPLSSRLIDCDLHPSESPGNGRRGIGRTMVR